MIKHVTILLVIYIKSKKKNHNIKYSLHVKETFRGIQYCITVHSFLGADDDV